MTMIDKTEAHDDDLIRRGDAEKAMLPFVHNVIADDAIAAIRALPATDARADALRGAVAAICAEDDDFIGIGKSAYDKADRILALIGGSSPNGGSPPMLNATTPPPPSK